MTRMREDTFGLCRTPDGRTIPCNPLQGNPPSGNGLAQLAMMLRGSGWLDRNYGGSGDAGSNTYPPPSANPTRPAYENSWAATPGNVGPFNAGSHLPFTKAQEIILPSMAEPWIETIPYGIRPWWEFPPMPDEISPLPFAEPNRLGPYDNPDEDWPFPDSEECKDEIANAHKFCRNHIKRLKSGLDAGNFGNTIVQCMRGMLFEECGGNPVGLKA